MRTQVNTGIVKQHIISGGEQLGLKMGYAVEAEAKEIITTKIYNRPQRGNYKRTGLARSSIQTELRRDNKSVLIGSDAAAFAKKRSEMASVATGSNVFYLPYLEYGTRFMPPVGMLRGGLDKVKH